MSLEQSPVGGLRLSHKQWIDAMNGKDVENLEKFPVLPETREKFKEWLLSLNATLSLSEVTKTLIQDTIDARFGSRMKEAKGTGSRWEVLPLDSVIFGE